MKTINLLHRNNRPRRGSDKTDYAIACGYTGKRRVIVQDGKIISHGNADWFEWITRVMNRAMAKGVAA